MLKEKLNLISSNINSEDVTANRTEIYRPTVHYNSMQRKLPKMTKGEKAAFYKRTFDDLLKIYAGQDTITLRGQYGSKPRTTTFAELEACKQIYTEDVTEKFWKVRNYLNNSEQLFFSPSGLLVTVKMKSGSDDFGLYWIVPLFVGTKNNRYRFDFRNRKDKTGGYLDIAKLVILVFNGECSPNVMRVLDEDGPEAIFNKIEVHHLYGYKAGDTPEETEQNIAENCNLDNIQLLTKEEHMLFTTYKSDMTLEETKKFVNKLMDICKFPHVFEHSGGRYGKFIYDVNGYIKALEEERKA